MALGEFEFGDLFHGDEALPDEDAVAAVLVFIGFVMIMTITLVNMILGLAFDDIAQIRRTAHLTKLAAKVEILFQLEVVAGSQQFGFLRSFSNLLKKFRNKRKEFASWMGQSNGNEDSHCSFQDYIRQIEERE